MEINVGDYVKQQIDFTGKDGKTEIIERYYKVLYVDAEHIEVVSLGNGSPFDFYVVHAYSDVMNMQIILQKELKIETITKHIMRKGIHVQHDIAQRYVWGDKEVIISLPNMYYNGTEFLPLDKSFYEEDIEDENK